MKPTSEQTPVAGGRGWIIAGLLLAFALSLGIRSLQLKLAFPDEETVRFAPHDASYHARRALYSFVNFPAVLTFDSYIAYPDGAPVPIPPLYDWLLAGVARIFGQTTLTFERVAAWASPLLSALTLLPIFAVGRRLGGSGVGLGAAFLFAILPASSNRSGIGNPDHHAAVALLAACWLASLVAEAFSDRERRRRWLHIGLHGAVMAAMMLVWSGSLLYLILGEGVRLLASAVVGRHPDRLRDQSVSALLVAGLVGSWVALTGNPLGGPFSTTELSWMHSVVLVALALLAALLAVLETFKPEPIAWRRVLRVAGLGLLIVVPLLSFEALREPLASGTGFLAKEDVWAALNTEQQPIFSSSPGKLPATLLFGWFAFLLPLAPLLVALRWRGGHPPEALVIVFTWTTLLALLTLGQVRYAMDFAVVGSAVFAWSLAGMKRWLAPWLPRAGLATALVIGIGVVLLWPPLRFHARVLVRFWKLPSTVAGQITSSERVRRFGEEIQRVTPETSGFLDSEALPEYGLLVPPSLGHSLLYYARRPVPANNFGPYLDIDKYHQASEFYQVASEAEAVAIAAKLGARYVVTQVQGVSGKRPGAFFRQLHLGDAAATSGRSALQHFRLITEAEDDGPPASASMRRRRPIHFKLFERVEGAVLEAQGEPGELLVAKVQITSPRGRVIRYRAVSRADSSGMARVRVPYSTDDVAPARATGPYAIGFSGARWQVPVSDASVREGAVLRIAPPDAAGSRSLPGLAE
ncbi:MAG: glycosyltransferase family 39 protein [Deltaproteobacteria bacterium]|nr:glycosyltransferase family 39 protein [Deltaproteobacteria bacterium]MBW2397017.1 glycosyltransferase family 39 protein [Deltaproteobacteria bacterium]